MLPLDDPRTDLALRSQDALRLPTVDWPQLRWRVTIGHLGTDASPSGHYLSPAIARFTASANFGSTASAAGRMYGLAPIRRVPNSTNFP